MKKLIYSAMAVAMLATTSCKDDFAESFVGDQATVEFSISTPEIATRAFSEGKLVDHLHYAIYEKISEGGNVTYQITQLVATGDNVVALENGKATLNLPLKTRKDYQAIFWADDEEAPYSVTFGENGASMSVDYAADKTKSNDEKRDAFYASVHINIEGNESKTVTLTRPFAQLNIGTDDYAAAKTAGYEPTLSSVTVDAYSAMDLMSGNVTGESIAKTFGYAAIPSAQDETFPVVGYDYLAMNYILVGNDKVTSEVTFRYKESENTAEETKTVGSVPFQRNYRTNIYGKLLTSTVDVNVEIKPDYNEPDYEVGTLVYDAQTLQDAIDAAPVGETTTIYLGATIEDDVTVTQKSGVKIIIDGSTTRSNVSYKGTIKVHSNSNHYADAALTLKNIDFKTSTASVNFIEAVENGSERYSTNITVEGCTFTAEGEAENTAVGVQIKASKNAKVIRCTATNMHSLIQAQSCDETVVVKDCTIEGKNGVAFKQVKSATVEGTTITATGYGIRFDGNTDNYGITVNNNNVTAAQPFIVRRMTGANNTIALEGTNTLTTEADYQIVITNDSDDKEYVKPTGTYTLTGAEGYTIFPELPVAKVGNTEYTSIDAAIAAWTNGSTLTLLSDVKLSDVVTLKSTEHHILNLGTYTMTAASSKNAFEIKACGTGASERTAITIKADTENPGGIKADKKCIIYYNYADGSATGDDRPIIKIEGGVFTGSTSSIGSTAGIYFKGGSEARQAATLNISGGTFNCSINGQSKSKLLISGGLFHYSVGSQGDSTALRLISGGTFKTLGFMTADSKNTKFWFGTSMANSNVGLYINDDNYLVVGGPVITEFGDKFAAKAKNPTKWNSLLQYSSATANGLYYTNADMAITKHGAANVEVKQ